MTQFMIAPSLLSADFSRLGEEAKAVLDAGADLLHLDVMDNHYVPNLTVGPMICKALRSYGIQAPIDVHLMTYQVDKLIVEFAAAGATYISFHPETSAHVDRSLQLIRDHGCKTGLALNPASSLHLLDYVWDKLDMILIMSVNPGFGGQDFIPSILDKISATRALINTKNLDIQLAVDGGIKVENLNKIAKAGANMFIAGSAIYSQKNYKTVIDAMRQELGRN